MKSRKSEVKTAPKVGFVSLGCPKNQLDTEVMLHKLMTAGYEITGDETEADVVIINTCAFIESAKQESIDNILDIAWLKKNAKLKGIIVTGCLAQRYHAQIFEEMPEVDAVLGVNSLDDIVTAVGKVLAKEEKYCSVRDVSELKLGGDRIVTTPEYTAYLKIAEGCDNRCTYCAIPGIRGPMRSRTREDIVEEAKTLEKLGVKELILVAQDTTRYGLDLYGSYALPELIRDICFFTEIPWIRLLYCYPDKITDELCEEFKNNPRLVKYIDLPIQHISDSVLKRMNRHGGSETIKDAVKRLRDACPDIVIRTTVICGFPGETEEDFAELCEFVKEARFDKLGAFAYSREEDTPAYDFDGQIDEQTKQERADRIMQLQLDISAELSEAKVGSTISVLCEGYDVVAESWYGRSSADAPEIDGKIYFQSSKKLKEGQFVDVRIDEAMDYDLLGEAVV
ncbi:MAG: 30S ribosomal protein S12 methylthiotransferase RimO [Clostridia bacterium]|nr:30S ribosomal protein S12 methylthiotransferase RimO [Clostridia bacterium]